MRIVTDPTFSFKKDAEDLLPFLGVSYKDPDAIACAQKQISSHSYPRKELVGILRNYNTLIGNDALALKNIERLILPDQGCVVTGQQLGLMGGPAYTILKGISCLLLARSSGAVPVFWLATEDHDVAEIDHTYLLDAYGNLKYFHLSFPKDGRCVEDLKLSQHHIDIIHQFLQAGSVPKHQWPVINESYAQTMAQVMVQLFSGTGMVFLEPKLLRPLGRNFFRREIEDCIELHKILQETTARLVAAGGEEVISFKGGTNLFLKDNLGLRQKILFNEDSFTCGKVYYSKQDMLSLIEDHPELFSTNVAARPVLQSLLIPTLAYVAGPSEYQYFRQLGDYHRAHNVPMPCIVPRLSATFIPAHAADIISKCNIDPKEQIPLHWMDLMPNLGQGFVQLQTDWHQSASALFNNEINPVSLERSIRESVRKLHKKVVKARLKSLGIPTHGLHLLRNLLHPHQKPQERVLNWWSFQGYSQKNLVKELLQLTSLHPHEHLYCYC